MGIRRDESEDLTRKKKGDGDAEPHAIPWEDTTEVSIVALRGFLEDLLGVTHHTAAEMEGAVAVAPLAPVEHSVNPQAARAANAYQSMGRAVHDRNVEMPHSQPPPALPSSPALESPASETGIESDFSEEDRERLRGYIADMNMLEQKGVTTLTLRRSLAFLDSIHQAIEEAMGISGYPE